jgi:glyoxylase-like metal-dependent hydrolase (beta-lactamase superfamily II)
VSIAAPAISDLGGGVTRVTHALPWALDHVHCYVVNDGEAVTVIDCGLGDERTVESWRLALAELGSPTVARVIVTHFHPDHIGAGATLVELTGAPAVVQGRLDAELSAAVWTSGESIDPYVAFFIQNGMPEQLARRSAEADAGSDVRLATPTRLVDDGDRLVLRGESFVVRVLPGHADGHIVLVGEESGRMFGGDVLLAEITPNVGRWPETAPDPLGSYLQSLREIQRLAPSIVYPGHGPAIAAVSERAAEIAQHHADRLDEHVAALRGGADTAYAVARVLWPGETLSFHEQRFALVEALAHLERLAAEGRAQSPAPGRWRAL